MKKTIFYLLSIGAAIMLFLSVFMPFLSMTAGPLSVSKNATHYWYAGPLIAFAIIGAVLALKKNKWASVIGASTVLLILIAFGAKTQSIDGVHVRLGLGAYLAGICGITLLVTTLGYWKKDSSSGTPEEEADTDKAEEDDENPSETPAAEEDAEEHDAKAES